MLSRPSSSASASARASQEQLESTIATLRDEVEALEATVTHLERALESNRSISAAVGIVMQQRTLTQGDAFDFLVETSQHRNIKLRDVAEYVLATRDLERGPSDARKPEPQPRSEAEHRHPTAGTADGVPGLSAPEC